MHKCKRARESIWRQYCDHQSYQLCAILDMYICAQMYVRKVWMSHVKDRDHRGLFVLLEDIHLEESDRKSANMFKEMIHSLGIFVSYSSKKKKNEMANLAIRQSYVQFSMTIFFHLSQCVCVCIPLIDRSNVVDSYLYLLHSTLTNWYMLLFNHTITSSLNMIVSDT